LLLLFLREALEHSGEAGPLIDGVGPRHGSIIELVDDLVARESPATASG
jgi:hypothetical protein